MSNTLSDETAAKLLDKLASDDDFRETFQKDPRKALAQVGHAPAADASVKEGIWSCMSVSKLADKKAIAESRDTLRKQLATTQAGAQPITLENPQR
ncbi:MAG TPA: NHLP-related RiPP peptide [Arenimonas sp.]|jgi:putative modified peptide|tara:strand:- start:6701 stop:6988 length:288 start_codon:yes stop_codon:yes gene_type:complete